MGTVILGLAAAAVAAGALRAREPFDASGLAEAALAASLGGGDARALPDALDRLRGRLDRLPLDVTSRTIYASLLAETAETDDGRARAAIEGERAVATAPHEEGVRCAEVKILARTGRTGAAVEATRTLFLEAPDDAAAVLAGIEPFLSSAESARALPDDAAAWRARAVRLRQDGRESEADVVLAGLLRRWPRDLPTIELVGAIAEGRGRFDEVARLVPPTIRFEESQRTARLIALRAMSRGLHGDADGARRDAARAAALAGGDAGVFVVAGDALQQLEPGSARVYWERALHAAKDAPPPSRVWILTRLARLDEAEGHASDALRRWREVESLSPGHAEASRRIAELTGAAR